MRTLYIDTSSSFLYSAIIEDNKILGEIKEEYGIKEPYLTLREYINKHCFGAYHTFHFTIANKKLSIDKVELEVTGGEFNATNGQPVVASEDVTGFVSGGIFNKAPLNEDLEGEPGKYIANGYE